MTDTKHLDTVNILIVDDTPDNLRLLTGMLLKRGYRPRPVPNGALALQAARTEPPDMILLDIHMPVMNGYEVCRQLKMDETLKDIPVIFISALNETIDKVKAFSVGGVDYVTKPFQFEEVEARVKTHLKLRELQRELQKQNLNLENLVTQRTRELEDAFARLKRFDRIKSDFLDMISHEVRTPLNGILNIAEFAFDLAPSSAERNELWELFEGSRNRMYRLLDDAAMLDALESTRQERPLARIPVAQTFQEAQQAVPAIHIRVDFPPNFVEICVPGEGALLKRAFETLIRLTACFTKSRDTVSLSGSVEQGQVRLRFALDNLDVSEKQASGFFEIASPSRSASYAEQLGLAPVVAHRIVAFFGGDVRLVKQEATTGVLQIELPQSEFRCQK